MCLDWFSSPRGKNMIRPIPGLRVPKQTPMETWDLVSRFHCLEPLPPSWILNSPPDWLKFVAAILDLENNRVYCSRNNSLLSFSAPDWLRPLWARYSSFAQNLMISKFLKIFGNLRDANRTRRVEYETKRNNKTEWRSLPYKRVPFKKYSYLDSIRICSLNISS